MKRIDFIKAIGMGLGALTVAPIIISDAGKATVNAIRVTLQEAQLGINATLEFWSKDGKAHYYRGFHLNNPYTSNDLMEMIDAYSDGMYKQALEMGYTKDDLVPQKEFAI